MTRVAHKLSSLADRHTVGGGAKRTLKIEYNEGQLRGLFQSTQAQFPAPTEGSSRASDTLFCPPRTAAQCGIYAGVGV